MPKEEKLIKEIYINNIKEQLSQFIEINKIIIFGSFIKAQKPNDIDIAIIQNSDNNFLTLSLKYRKVLRELSKKIPLDILPLKENSQGIFMEEVSKGKIIYER
jgi:predicted nucleotidyltransferase